VIARDEPGQACADWVDAVFRTRDLAAAWPFTSFALRYMWVAGARADPGLMMHTAPELDTWPVFAARSLDSLTRTGGWLLDAHVDGVEMLTGEVASVVWRSDFPEAMSDTGEPQFGRKRVTMVYEAALTLERMYWLVAGWDDLVADLATATLQPVVRDATTPPAVT